MKDRRSTTSRANLGEHIPEAIDPDGSVVVGVRLPQAAVKYIDMMRNGTRSDFLRGLIAEHEGLLKAIKEWCDATEAGIVEGDDAEAQRQLDRMDAAEKSLRDIADTLCHYWPTEEDDK